MTELKYFILKTKLENEDNKMNVDKFFDLIKHKIGWKEYMDLLSEFSKNSFLSGENWELLTELGKNRLQEYELQLNQSKKDEEAERNKLYNESVMSGWKRKTFWYIFALGLFGGIYSGIDLFRKITSSKEIQQEPITKQQMESELTKLRTLILTQKSQDSLINPNPELNN